MTEPAITWLSPDDPPDAFPDVASALREPNGLLAAGGDLSTQRLLAAYSTGIFPWFNEGEPILWWCPDPRCVLQPQDLHVSRRLAQDIRKSGHVMRFDTAFARVVDACAAPRRSQSGTWITSGMAAAYTRLFEQGWGHSVEVWDGERLVGGMYGLCIGTLFFGESMFSAEPGMSKIAMLGLTRYMLASGMELLDCQVASPHLLSLGAKTMPRVEFVTIVRAACRPPVARRDWPTEATAVSGLL